MATAPHWRSKQNSCVTARGIFQPRTTHVLGSGKTQIDPSSLSPFSCIKVLGTFHCLTAPACLPPQPHAVSCSVLSAPGVPSLCHECHSIGPLCGCISTPLTWLTTLKFPQGALGSQILQEPRKKTELSMFRNGTEDPCKVRGRDKKMGQRDSENTSCYSSGICRQEGGREGGPWVHFLVLTDNEGKVWDNRG